MSPAPRPLARWFIVLATLAALALRLQRLEWQPLWWDEGYSIYFATEPVARMADLTAADIHPPLYYLLLHGWFTLLADSGPVTARLLSVLLGVLALPAAAALLRRLLPNQPTAHALALILLAVSPWQTYYSQEVRMYGLALLLTLIATILFWDLISAVKEDKSEGGRSPLSLPRESRIWLAYVITAALALLTLYYSGLILLAHQLWALTLLGTPRPGRSRLIRWAWSAAAATLLLQAPWWGYALPRLIEYVAAKVVADQDTPLGLHTYLWRHALALFSGHLVPTADLAQPLRQILTGAMLLLAALGWRRLEAHPRRFLLTLILAPFSVGFLINLRLPFFPDGGERLLLPILPYALVLVAATLPSTVFQFGRAQRAPAAARPRLRVWLLGIPLSLALLGQLAFFTQPRYADHDYRALIRYVWQHARAQDTVFAIFPWQVGYWRAYSPGTAAPIFQFGRGSAARGHPAWLPPQPPPLTQEVLTWSPALAARLDDALTTGTVWFPAPLSFGSALPPAIESHLAARAAILDNRWFSPATRLSAWTALPPAPAVPTAAQFTPDLHLTHAAVGPTRITADNSPLAVTLTWSGALPRPDLRLTLRLVDSDGHVWAQRDHTPVGQFARSAVHGSAISGGGAPSGHPPLGAPKLKEEALALTIPAGLPPQSYRLTLGIGPIDDERLFIPTRITPDGQATPLTSLTDITVIAPDLPPDTARLPIQVPLTPPLTADGLTLLGFAAPRPEAGALWARAQGAPAPLSTPHLAGEPLNLTLFLANGPSPAPRRDLYVALLTAAGAGAGGWEGWPLPTYTTDTWPDAALAQVPVTVNTAADLPPGRYQLVAGFLDPATNAKSPATRLGDLTVTRRAANFTPTAPQYALDTPILFGNHAHLTGYSASWQGDELTLALHWQTQQPLLPPHAIFVHLTDDTGALMAQADGEPTTFNLGEAPPPGGALSGDFQFGRGSAARGRAPSGSWLPGEFLTTLHTLTAVPVNATQVRVGLYNPATLVRLPATADGLPLGDTAIFSLPRPIP
jgi:hypothetical protein